MDSLLANYASSDDDDVDWEAEVSCTRKPSSLPASDSTSVSSSLFSPSLPPPRASTPSSSPSSSLFSSLPPPNKSQLTSHSLNLGKDHEYGEKSSMHPVSSSIFSSLLPPKATPFSISSFPAPKFQSGNPSNKPTVVQTPNKRVVHITLPLNPTLLKSHDSDNDDEDEEKQKKLSKDAASSSAPITLSSMLPAPKNSLCIAPAQSSGASRRSSLQAEDSSQNRSQELKSEQDAGNSPIFSYQNAEQGVATGYYDSYGKSTREQWVSDCGNYSNAPEAVGLVDSTYADNSSMTQWEQVDGNGVGYGSYTGNWSTVSLGAEQPDVPHIGMITGRRRRTDIPTEIIEVKQDELMKNRPREDQIKSTGIAFGPAYQPAPSGKGKPSKLHKRKHQIGSLYYDLKQKEMELAERRSKGLLTKAETQAKYGW